MYKSDENWKGQMRQATIWSGEKKGIISEGIISSQARFCSSCYELNVYGFGKPEKGSNFKYNFNQNRIFGIMEAGEL